MNSGRLNAVVICFHDTSAAFERGVAVRIALACAVALTLACGAAARGEPDAFMSAVEDGGNHG